jgi:hypothetical protein
VATNCVFTITLKRIAIAPSIFHESKTVKNVDPLFYLLLPCFLIFFDLGKFEQNLECLRDKERKIEGNFNLLTA